MLNRATGIKNKLARIKGLMPSLFVIIKETKRSSIMVGTVALGKNIIFNPWFGAWWGGESPCKPCQQYGQNKIWYNRYGDVRRRSQRAVFK